MNRVRKFMAVVCQGCFLCQYARKHPEGWFGKLMQWHGKWCPFWKAREEIYGE